MALNTPWLMQKSGGDPDIAYSGQAIREPWDMVVQSEGVFTTASLKVSQRGAGANYSVDVAAGDCAITGDSVAFQGKYLCRSTSVVNLVVPTTPSGTRIHRVVARIKDKTHDGAATTYEWTIELLQDSGSGTPATPSSAISLATVSVASGAANITDAMITDTRPSASLAGSSSNTVVASDAGRPSSPYVGQQIYRSDKPGCFEVWDGTAWRLNAAAATLYTNKPSDQSRTSNISLIDDTALQLTMSASAEYDLDIKLLYSADSNGDLKLGFTFPVGGGVDLVVTGLASGVTGTTGDANHLILQGSGNVTLGGAAAGSNAALLGARISGHVYSGAGGLLKLQFAQGTSSGTATIIRAWSTMTLTRRV